MSLKNWKKVKLVMLAELLQRETDEQHPLDTYQICDRLTAMDIPCDRAIVSRDVALLRESGFEVMEMRVGKKKAYYLEENQGFSGQDLKILIEAVQAASWIPETMATELIDKLAELGGTYKEEKLKSGLECFTSRKCSNENVCNTVDTLKEAILQEKKAVFQYFDLGMNQEKVYRRDGHLYVADPVALIYDEDNYYLVAYSDGDDDTANYRIDRMESVEMIEEDVSEKVKELHSSIGEDMEQALKMYGGPFQTIVLEFDGQLTGAVYDRFGESINMIPVGKGRIAAMVRAQISPAFWEWLFQFGKRMSVISPDEVTEEYRQKVAELRS